MSINKAALDQASAARKRYRADTPVSLQSIEGEDAVFIAAYLEATSAGQPVGCTCDWKAIPIEKRCLIHKAGELCDVTSSDLNHLVKLLEPVESSNSRVRAALKLLRNLRPTERESGNRPIIPREKLIELSADAIACSDVAVDIAIKIEDYINELSKQEPSKLTASMNCPICGWTIPHTHDLVEEIMRKISRIPLDGMHPVDLERCKTSANEILAMLTSLAQFAGLKNKGEITWKTALSEIEGEKP